MFLSAWVGERTELAVVVGVTGLAAYVGYETGGLTGTEISAVVPAFVAGLISQRKENTVTMARNAADLAQIEGPDLIAWIEADDQHASFFQETLEAAWSTLDQAVPVLSVNRSMEIHSIGAQLVIGRVGSGDRRLDFVLICGDQRAAGGISRIGADGVPVRP